MTPAAREQQRAAALAAANTRRHRLAELRRQARTGQAGLTGLLLDPPVELRDVLLVDVVRMSRSQRMSSGIARLGRLAVRDGINLLIPLGQASQRTRAWVAEHACWHMIPMAGTTRGRLELRVTDEAPL